MVGEGTGEGEELDDRLIDPSQPLSASDLGLKFVYTMYIMLIP